MKLNGRRDIKIWITSLVALVIIIEGVFMLYFMPKLKIITDYPMIDMAFYFGEYFNEIINDYGNDGLALYQKMHLLDFIFPLVYGSLLFLLLRKERLLRWLPLIGMSSDYLENILITILIHNYSQFVSYVAFGFTCLKFLGLILSIGAVVFITIKVRRS
ncbi:MAG: hypothetical protein JXR88_01355 [Clostridia bacterium]|nr:hypothetical protein [Clostridia bacterium]